MIMYVSFKIFVFIENTTISSVSTERKVIFIIQFSFLTKTLGRRVSPKERSCCFTTVLLM